MIEPVGAFHEFEHAGWERAAEFYGDAFGALTAQAGFADVKVRELPLAWRLAHADAVFEALSRGGVPTAAVLRAQTSDALAAIRAAVRRGVEAYARDDGFSVPMPAVPASARTR